MHRRGSFVNSRIRFERDKKGHVAFIGGSITEMNGYRPMVSTFLKLQFPATELTFTDAGIASTCSTTGAFRLQQDVLDKGPVDLFFIEFAVNDDQDAGHARRECIRGMEGIVKHTLAHNPHADIVITHFVNPGMLETIRKGETPLSIAAHETVAERYAVTTIDLAQEVSDRITAGRLTWEEYGGTHPKPFGNAMCASMIEDLLAGVWKEPLRDDEKFTRLPKFIQPLDERSYNRGRFVDPKEAKIVRGWNLQVPDWDKLPGSKRDRFTGIPMLCATSAEAEASLEFTGTAIGASIVAGPDAGIVDASIDGGEFQPFDLYHRFSKGLHYPRTVMFNADLKPGRHTLRLRVSQKRNAESTGHAMRIIKFAVNGDE